MFDVIRVMDSNYEDVYTITDYYSLIWNTQYYGTGDFELKLPANSDVSQYLIADNFIYTSDSEQLGVIEKVSYSYSINDGHILTVSGRFAKCLLARRVTVKGFTNNKIIVPKFTTTQTAPYIAMELVKDNATVDSTFAPAHRKLNCLMMGSDNTTTQTSVESFQTTADNLLDVTDNLLATYELASELIWNNENNKLIYNVYEGNETDIVFSSARGDITDFNCELDYSSQGNYMFVGGAGDGGDRTWVHTDYPHNDPYNDARKEYYVNASGISKTYTTASGQSATYDASTYVNMLYAQGRTNATTTNAIVTNISATIDINNTGLVYKEDFRVGDIVTVYDETFNLYVKLRILSVTESVDANGYVISIELGV